MITSINLLRNIGQYDSVSSGSSLPLNRLTLIYAENGRGKTTLASILRSLGTGDPLPIAERTRLSATNPPHVVLDCVGGPPSAMFQNNAWNRSVGDIVVFDDVFVHDNVCSGLEVVSDHRKKLHELIIGAQGVALHNQLQALIAQVEEHNRALRRKSSAIPSEVLNGLTVDAFCDLVEVANIDDAIQEAERKHAAASASQQIHDTPAFDTISLPAFDVVSINELLGRDLPSLNANSAARVQQHLEHVGENAEEWVAEGYSRLPGETHDACPFCAQDLSESSIVGHYQGYFGEEYAGLKEDIENELLELNSEHADEAPVRFETSLNNALQRKQFWDHFAEAPEIDIDSEEIRTAWRNARQIVFSELQAKRSSPLEPSQLSSEALAAINEFQRCREEVEAISQRFQEFNEEIELIKEQASSANLDTLAADVARLKATKQRYSPAIRPLCLEYLQEKAAKLATEIQRDQAKIALTQYREVVFPTYESSINTYLSRFNANFRLSSVRGVESRSGSSCHYSVIINQNAVSVGGTTTPGAPSFRTALSAGDRNTLALAFFFASLDQDAQLSSRIIVIDDPITSLDDHRSLTTIQEIRRLVDRTAQVIILSHSKLVLCRLSEHPDLSLVSAICVTRDGTGSTLSNWDVTEDSITEHDRRHSLLRAYRRSNTGNGREVARSIRPVVEAYLRVVCPEYFPPGTLLGPFRGLCEQRLGTPDQILTQSQIDELRDITTYANRFHHDTNPAWDTVVVNDTELLGYVERVLAFTAF